MAAHEFGIMEATPGPERCDTYEPAKYRCIQMDDAWIGPLLPRLQAMECFWHTRTCPGRGLACCGITLIPPESLPVFCAVLRRADNPRLEPLARLLEQAAGMGKFVIHFGL